MEATEKLRIWIVSIYVTVVHISACKFANEYVLKRICIVDRYINSNRILK